MTTYIPHIAVIRQTDAITDADVDDMIAAVQHQVSYQFRLHWASNATLARYDSPPPKQRFLWPCYLMAHSDVPGAGGYHDDDAQVELKVFVDDTIDYGANWTVTASHEILETLADPQASRSIQVGNSTWWALEVCDTCEADQYAYGIKVHSGNTVMVSDWAKPSWWGAPVTDATAPFDYMGHVTKAKQLLPGGYIGQWTPSTGWVQKVAADNKALPSHRIAARAVHWGQDITTVDDLERVVEEEE